MLRRILCLGLLAIVFTAAPASAQYVDVDASVENNVVSGSGCAPGSTVDFTLLTTGGQQVADLGSTVADSNGMFSMTVDPTGVANGTYQLIVACGDATTSIPVQVSSSGLSPGQTTTPVTAGVGSGLARTGSDSGTLVRGAAVLIAIGGLLLVGTRRRLATA